MDKAMRSTFGLTLAQFEQRWRDHTRRRYGALAVLSDVTAGGLIILVVVFPLYVARRHRDKRRLAAMVVADEIAERAARESAIEALLRGDDESDFGGGPPGEAGP